MNLGMFVSIIVKSCPLNAADTFSAFKIVTENSKKIKFAAAYRSPTQLNLMDSSMVWKLSWFERPYMMILTGDFDCRSSSGGHMTLSILKVVLR